MRLPSRVTFFPPVPSGRDLFGLPRNRTLLSDDDAAVRETIERWLRDAWKDAVKQLGETEAQKLFHLASLRSKKRRGKGKNIPPDSDKKLLAHWDEARKTNPSLRLGSFAGNHKHQERYGCTQRALRARLERAIEARRKQRRQQRGQRMRASALSKRTIASGD